MSTARLSTAASSRGIESMEVEVDMTETERKYPSIKDYYHASSTSTSKPIQLQNGLSNYSSLQLGDDRIMFTESVMSATFHQAEEKRPLSPSKMKTRHLRQREYEMARSVVNGAEVDRLERVMKDKLIQRSEHVSSPFQIRKALKFFDAEKSGYISLEDFTHALEFLGFQFSEVQNMALFARYDTNFSGGIDYMTFIKEAMFYDPTQAVTNPSKQLLPNKNRTNKTSTEEVADFSEAELAEMQEQELRRVFALVNKSGSGSLDRTEFELLLMALGFNLPANCVDGCLMEITGCSPNDSNVKVVCGAFLCWWIDRESIYLYKKK